MSYAAISLGLFIFILTYFTWNAPIQEKAEPIEIAPAVITESTQYCQLADPATAPTFQAPRDDASKIGWDDQDLTSGTVIREKDGIRHNFMGNTAYRLVRKNVPMTINDVKKNEYLWDDSSTHFDTAEKFGFEIPEVDRSKFKIFFPEIAGEISLNQPLFSRTRNRDSNYMYFIDFGLVFLLHLNPDGSYVEMKGGTTEGSAETFYLADVYQDSESGRPSLPPEALACDTTKGAAIANTPTGPAISIPDQSGLEPDQLQIKYFVFTSAAQQQGGSGPVVNGWGVHCKPAVYLYPPEKQLVNVKVYPSGFLTYVDPPYDNKKGWTVWASPDGKLTALSSQPSAVSKVYDYLYFESKIRDEVIEKPTKGWVVKYEELTNLYQNILPKLGLNEQQKNDFTEYWNKALAKNPSPYYFVGVINQDNVNEIEKLEITPKPDSINRVRIYFERLEAPKLVEAPILQPKTFTLSPDKFSVVEWGGMVKNDKDHPFTCSL